MLQYVNGKPYFTDNRDIIQYKYLTEDKKTDVLIIGGGVTGAICSYYFAKAGIKTIMVEAKRIAHGSTSTTTSLLQYELDSNAQALRSYTTLENVEQSYKVCIFALNEISDFIKTYGNRCRYMQRDTFLFTDKNNEIEELKQEYEFRKSNGIDSEFKSEFNNPFSFNIKAGVYSKNGGAEIDPYLFTHQLIDAGEKYGLSVYENTEVTDIIYSDENVTAITEFGNKIYANKVIICTGYDTDRFTKYKFGTKTLTYNIVTKPCKELNGYYSNVLIRDNKDPYNYYRTTFDNRIIAGGKDIPFETGLYDEGTAKQKYDEILSDLKRMFPNIKDLAIDYSYCGCFASTNDDLGFIGKDKKEKCKWYCLGYGANGILFAIIGANILRDMYNNKDNKYAHLFYPYRFDKK